MPSIYVWEGRLGTVKCPVCDRRMAQITAFETDIYFKCCALWSFIGGKYLKIEPERPD